MKYCEEQFCPICIVTMFFSKLKKLFRELNFRRKYGFKSIDIFNLDYTMAKFILPRLKLFKETTFCHPHGLTMQKWKNILDHMIYAFDCEVRQWDEDIQEIDYKRVQKGFNLFGKYFKDLWI